MLHRLSCRHRHHWQAPDLGSDAQAAASLRCPICGSLADTLQEPEPAAPTPLPITHPKDIDSLPRSPVQVPGFEILGELGRGGAGVVDRARQLALDRPIALKMLLSGTRATPRAGALPRRGGGGHSAAPSQHRLHP